MSGAFSLEIRKINLLALIIHISVSNARCYGKNKLLSGTSFRCYGAKI